MLYLLMLALLILSVAAMTVIVTLSVAVIRVAYHFTTVWFCGNAKAATPPVPEWTPLPNPPMFTTAMIDFISRFLYATFYLLSPEFIEFALPVLAVFCDQLFEKNEPAWTSLVDPLFEPTTVCYMPENPILAFISTMTQEGKANIHSYMLFVIRMFSSVLLIYIQSTY